MKLIIQFIKFWLCLLLLAAPFSGKCQRAITLNTDLKKIAERSSNTSWIYFIENSNLPADQIFITHPIEFGLSPSDEMRLMSTNEDDMTGLTRQKFKQFHSEIPVHGGSVMLFSKNGIALKAKGSIIQNLPTPQSGIIAEAHAIETAVQIMPGTDYLWLDEQRVERYQQRKNDPAETFQPKAELIYLNNTGTNSSLAKDYTLCWKVEVYMQRSGSYAIVLDAFSGKFIRKIPLFINCNGTSANTPMNGTQTIYTSKQGRCTDPSYYELWDDCAVDIKVENDDLGSGDDEPICTISSNSWTNLSGLSGDGVQVLWGMRTSYDWFLSNFGWDSYDDAGASIDCTVFYEFGDFPGDNGNNAQYEIFEEDFDFGYGTSSSDPLDSYTCLDIVGHEYMHGVNDYTADLDLGGESGALNESFADIFAEAIEQMTVNLPESQKWYNGQAKTGKAVRNMKDPNAYDDPETYLTDVYWDAIEQEVHNNACVQDYFFYLLCEGGSGTNANGDSYSVNGIGLYAGITIAWYALNYLDDNEYYIDSRDAWLEAAKDIYGNCSNEMIQVGNAWFAVGVGSQSPYNTVQVMSNVSSIFDDNILEAIELLYTIGNVSVETMPGTSVIFYASQEIILYPGFKVESGNEFVADIHACSVTLHDDPAKIAFGNGSSSNASNGIPEEGTTSVYPNPAHRKVTFEFLLKNDGDVSVHICDLSGKMIQTVADKQSFPTGVHQLEIQTESFSSGTYLCVADISGEKHISKLVIQH